MSAQAKAFLKRIIRRVLPPLNSLPFKGSLTFKKKYYQIRDWLYREQISGRYSQSGQDVFVARELDYMRHGQFLDIGAHDGESYSNTLYLEKELDWSGVCVEPHPDAYDRLQRLRNCTCIQAAVAPEARTQKFLRVVGQGEMLSGLQSTHFDEDLVYKYAEESGSEVHLIDVNCMTPEEISTKAGLKTFHYVNIDTEGGELDILKMLPLQRWGVHIITIERNLTERSIETYMRTHGFRLKAILGSDEVYIKVD